MNGCKNWKDDLLECALGAPPSSDLAKHLGECAACSAALAALRARSAEMDSAVGALVRGAEPSPEFHPRVMAAVEARRAETLAWPARRRLLAGAAMVAAAILLLLTLTGRLPNPGRRGTTPIAPTTLSRWRSPTERLLVSSGSDLMKSSPRIGDFYFPITPAPRGADDERKDRRKT